MLCGYNTNGLQSHRLDDALTLLAETGFEAVALTLDVAHLDPFRATPADVEHVARRLRDLGLRPVVETGARYLLDPARKHEPTLMTADPDARARRLDFYARAAAIGRDLGAAVVSFWSGIDRAPGPDSADRLREGVLRTCEVVRAVGLVPALEPEPGMAVGDVAAFERLAADLGADAPDLTLDIGHLYVNETEPTAALIERVGPRIRQVHLEDMKRGIHDHLEPGQGEVDFAGDLGALAATGYDGPVCFELSRSSHRAPEAMQICRTVWQHASVDPDPHP